jgi:protein-S-isoprenylcysteine O-methyltransferase Ste14
MVLFLKNLLFTLVVPGTVGVFLPLKIAEGHSSASGLVFAIACAFFAIATAVYVWGVWNFAVFGRGTPAPIDPPKKLIVRGLYRYTRNPMYLGVLTAILGWAILFRATILVFYAMAVGACCHLFIVFYEEPHLQRKFGKDYDEYRAQVNRWLPKPWRQPIGYYF